MNDPLREQQVSVAGVRPARTLTPQHRSTPAALAADQQEGANMNDEIEYADHLIGGGSERGPGECPCGCGPRGGHDAAQVDLTSAPGQPAAQNAALAEGHRQHGGDPSGGRVNLGLGGA